MRKALAQNPNLLRTLVGLSFTLIFILAYAVYGASQNSDYYVYTTDSDERQMELSEIANQHYDSDGEEWTMWIWQFTTNGSNLTWVNSTVTSGVEGGKIILINAGSGYWSHPDLGKVDAKQFSCSESCLISGTHTATIDDSGEATIVGLTSVDPKHRDGGTVRSENIDDAENMSRENIEYLHPDNAWQLRLELPGNHTEIPTINVTSVNEGFSDVHRFEIDPATELVWATFSVIGCFTTLLVPAFGIYFAAQAKERRAEAAALSTKEEE